MSGLKLEQHRKIAILVFDEVEVLDFCGPFEVFSVTGQREGEGHFQVYTVSETGAAIRARNGLTVTPDYGLANCPQPDILVVPGGYGTRREMNNPVIIDWVRERAAEAELTLSVCTGSLLLGKAGLLDGLDATTHHDALDLLRRAAPGCRVRAESRFVDNGQIISSGGISAGIDMAFHVVARLLGEAQARETAAHMEYRWIPEPGVVYETAARD